MYSVANKIIYVYYIVFGMSYIYTIKGPLYMTIDLLSKKLKITVKKLLIKNN